MGPALRGMCVGGLVFLLLLMAFGAGTGPVEFVLGAVLAVAASWGTTAPSRRRTT